MALTNTEMYQILNETYESMGMAETGANYITDETLPNIGVTSPELRGDFIDQLMLVLNQRFWRGIFTPSDNFARAFTVDLGSNGWGMLDTFQQFIDGSTPMWDNTKTPADIANDLVTPVSQKLSRKYYDTPMSIQFKNTINRRETAKIFTIEGMRQFIDNATAILASSAEVFLMNEIINEIKTAKENGDFVIYDKEFNLSDKDNINEFLACVRGVAKDMTIPSTLYNAESVLNNTTGSKTYIITNHIVNERINVLGRANSFNLSLSEYDIDTLYAPSENNLFDDILAIVLDRRAIIMGIRTYMMENFFVKNTLWENYWLSIEGIKGHNRFFSAVIFKGGVTKNSIFVYNNTNNVRYYSVDGQFLEPFTSYEITNKILPDGTITVKIEGEAQNITATQVNTAQKTIISSTPTLTNRIATIDVQIPTGFILID